MGEKYLLSNTMAMPAIAPVSRRRWVTTALCDCLEFKLLFVDFRDMDFITIV